MHCINRNIVECKEKSAEMQSFSLSIVLIETLWNVKSGIGCYNVLRCIVLIETLWNEKMFKKFCEQVFTNVLIETLWNVKSGTVEIKVCSYEY